MTITQSVEVVAAYFKGKRLEKFRTSIDILQAAEKRGSYQARESTKALVGFGPGLVTRKKCDENLRGDFPSDDRWPRFHAEFCLCHGHPYETWVEFPFSVEGVPQAVVEAWVRLCGWAHKTHKVLLAARPAPVVTAIGLSPKVTKTLTEMYLDLDLATVTPAKIESYQEQARHAKTGALLFNKDGSPAMTIAYRVKWSEGTKIGLSRFRDGCQACGKWIPSGQYVPIEADCRRSGRIGLWLGRDCAHNVFGVKDLGISRGE
jgi:hypothetical protein